MTGEASALESAATGSAAVELWTVLRNDCAQLGYNYTVDVLLSISGAL